MISPVRRSDGYAGAKKKAVQQVEKKSDDKLSDFAKVMQQKQAAARAEPVAATPVYRGEHGLPSDAFHPNRGRIVSVRDVSDLKVEKASEISPDMHGDYGG